MSESCVPLPVQPRADYRALYVRARHKICVLRSALFDRRARQPSDMPERQQDPFQDRLSLLATCACQRRELALYRGLLDTLSANELRVLRVRHEATVHDAAAADAIVTSFLVRRL